MRREQLRKKFRKILSLVKSSLKFPITFSKILAAEGNKTELAVHLINSDSRMGFVIH